jgi:hypothetical protein
MKKVLLIVVSVLTITIIGAYFAVPIVVSNIIRGKITENSANSVRSIEISWAGPQILSGLHLQDGVFTADVRVELADSLLDFIRPNALIHVDVRGDVVIHTSTDSEGESVPEEIVLVIESNESGFSIPNIVLTTHFDTLTIEGDESFVLHDIQGELLVDPGRHFGGKFTASSDSGGTIECVGNAPDILTKEGDFNWDASGECVISIENVALPTINGQGGWSIVKMSAQISSPKFSDAINVSGTGSFAEYDEQKGFFVIKTQLISTDQERGAFVFDDKEIVGTVRLAQVPTTILAPLLNKYDIDPLRDIGKTMDVDLERTLGGPPMRASFTSDKLQASAIVDSDNGTITKIDVTVEVHSELIQKFTDNQIQGSANVTLHFDRLVPYGFSPNDGAECVGNVDISGKLLHVPSNTKIRNVLADFSADLGERKIVVDGSALLNGVESRFHTSLHSNNKNKLNSVADLYTTIVNRFPHGTGTVVVELVPTRIVKPYIPEDGRELLQYIGPNFSSTLTFVQDGFRIEVASEPAEMYGTVQLKGDEFVSLNNAMVKTKLSKALATELFGVPVNAESTLLSNIKSVDLDGNAEFDLSFDIGKQHTFIQGTTTRQNDGKLDGYIVATGIDTHLLDAILECNGLLVDSIGSPIAVEVKATDLLNEPILVAGGTSPNAAFETSIGFFDGKLFTIPGVATRAELQLSSSLTKHLLKDLGPVLSDIRSVKRPIQMQVSQVQTSLDGDISTLNADVYIDIGEVELDSGSVTMKLLPMFNTKHVEVIPAFFEPIFIEIRSGIATYRKFNLTLANKYTIPYSGTINFVNRQLELHTAVPLTGLGYSIKELRGLATDIDVPILITGTIDNPVTKVDPSFDLSKILQSVAITAIGDAIGDAFGSGDKEAPNPLDLLEGLLGGN